MDSNLCPSTYQSTAASAWPHQFRHRTIPYVLRRAQEAEVLVHEIPCTGADQINVLFYVCSQQGDIYTRQGAERVNSNRQRCLDVSINIVLRNHKAY